MGRSKQSGDYYYVATGTGRLLPKRGNIKRQILASVAASILDALKRIGTTLAEIIHYAMAASSCDNFSPGKVTTIASAMDLLRALRP
jgi:hypothetical protein